jgi:hypothetical protein
MASTKLRILIKSSLPVRGCPPLNTPTSPTPLSRLSALGLNVCSGFSRKTVFFRQ